VSEVISFAEYVTRMTSTSDYQAAMDGFLLQATSATFGNDCFVGSFWQLAGRMPVPALSPLRCNGAGPLQLEQEASSELYGVRQELR